MDKYHDLEPVSLYCGPYSIIFFLIEQNSWNSAKFLPLLIHSSAGERFSFVCRSAWYTEVADDVSTLRILLRMFHYVAMQD